ncbi:radical SAM protein [Methanoculleus oceani]|uniref:Radical SAM core domain-containing protein n=1 Tax=Methanoculleus oceani TaxID=2184756 RepID=A0ABD4T9M6_9EURY|nr:radical SAM protein [Methanoculleus sp. CWC-02]MCM2464877.1 hypothetical protein [Methanoculleus sp. CWC-02]
MEDKFSDLVQQNLFSESPDIPYLKSIIESNLELNSEDTNELIYSITLKLNSSLFPPVTGIELILTEGCNLACSYCFEKDMAGHSKMPRNIAAKAIDLLIDYSNDCSELHITYFGGEPLLNYSVMRYITEYAQEQSSLRNKSINFNMTTNGTLLNRSIVEYLSSNKIKVLVSVDGLRRTHDKHRKDKNGNGTFDRVYKNLKLLKEKQPWIGIKMTIMPIECKYLFDDVINLYNMGVNQFLIGPATGVSWSAQTINTYLSQLEKLYEWYFSYPRSDLRINEFDEIENKPFFGCHAGRTNIAVGIDGQISPCSKILAINNTNLLSKLGNVYLGLTNFKNRLRLNECSELHVECERMGISEEYRGGCYASNYYETGSLFIPSMKDHNFDKARHSLSEKFQQLKRITN